MSYSALRLERRPIRRIFHVYGNVGFSIEDHDCDEIKIQEEARTGTDQTEEWFEIYLRGVVAARFQVSRDWIVYYEVPEPEL